MARLTETVKHLIIINVLFFVATFILKSRGVDLDQYLALFFIKNPHFQPWQFITTMFMHANINHILFNMLGLWMFGSPLEQMWGKNKFLFFYFSAGIGASLIYTLVNYLQFQPTFDALLSAGLSESQIQTILTTGSYNPAILEHISEASLSSLYQIFNSQAVGASGAIMGLLVGFGMLFPNAELMLIFFPVPVKAKYFIPVLIGLDVFSGVTGVSVFGAGNIAHWAHIGGALVGLIMMIYWKRTQFDKNRWN